MFGTIVNAHTLLLILGFAWIGVAQPLAAQGPPDDSPGVCDPRSVTE